MRLRRDLISTRDAGTAAQRERESPPGWLAAAPPALRAIRRTTALRAAFDGAGGASTRAVEWNGTAPQRGCGGGCHT
jgi:hypothetical protein